MEEPVEKKLYLTKIHKSAVITYIGCGLVTITIVLIASYCYFALRQSNEKKKEPNSTEVYILKDEVVETGYIHDL